MVALYFACENEGADGKLFRLEAKTPDIKYSDSDVVSVVSNIARRPIDFSIGSPWDLECKDFSGEPDIAYLPYKIKYERPHFQNVINSKGIERVFYVKPMFDNPRIIRRSGAFFLYGINGNKNKPAQSNSRYRVYIINKAQKQEIRRQLKALGIGRSTSLPEVEHVAECIRDKHHPPR